MNSQRGHCRRRRLTQSRSLHLHRAFRSSRILYIRLQENGLGCPEQSVHIYQIGRGYAPKGFTLTLGLLPPDNQIKGTFYELFNNLFTQPKFEERSSVKMLNNPLACWCAHEFRDCEQIYME